MHKKMWNKNTKSGFTQKLNLGKPHKIIGLLIHWFIQLHFYLPIESFIYLQLLWLIQSFIPLIFHLLIKFLIYLLF